MKKNKEANEQLMPKIVGIIANKKKEETGMK